MFDEDLKEESQTDRKGQGDRERQRREGAILANHRNRHPLTAIVSVWLVAKCWQTEATSVQRTTIQTNASLLLLLLLPLNFVQPLLPLSSLHIRRSPTVVLSTREEGCCSSPVSVFFPPHRLSFQSPEIFDRRLSSLHLVSHASLGLDRWNDLLGSAGQREELRMRMKSRSDHLRQRSLTICRLADWRHLLVTEVAEDSVSSARWLSCVWCWFHG